MGLGSWLAAAGDLLVGAQCPGCDEPWWGVCPECRSAVEALPTYLTRPEPCPAGFPLTATSSPYGALMKRLISAHKEHQVLALTPFLADRLAAAVGHLLSGPAGFDPGTTVLLVPVPSSPAAVRRRGFDATWAIARRAARAGRPGVRVRAQQLLSMSRRVQDQAGLGATARRENLRGSLRVTVSRLPAGSVAVIVDDVVTTGSSITEAARALRAVRMPVLGAATVAATVRSRSRTLLSDSRPEEGSNPKEEGGPR
jgi:predicted amidophosphoribosyltransferase